MGVGRVAGVGLVEAWVAVAGRVGGEVPGGGVGWQGWAVDAGCGEPGAWEGRRGSGLWGGWHVVEKGKGSGVGVGRGTDWWGRPSGGVGGRCGKWYWQWLWRVELAA